MGTYAGPLTSLAKGLLARLAEAAGLTAGHEISLILCDNAFMRRTNLRWRSIDRTTDVLSFPLYELKPGRFPPPGAVGDIVVSLPYLRQAARERGVPADRHLAWLLVHGLLHLLGHDHHEPRAAARMTREEQRLLAEVASA
jgi:probable rRNA maturation factor